MNAILRKHSGSLMAYALLLGLVVLGVLCTLGRTLAARGQRARGIRPDATRHRLLPEFRHIPAPLPYPRPQAGGCCVVAVCGLTSSSFARRGKGVAVTRGPRRACLEYIEADLRTTAH